VPTFNKIAFKLRRFVRTITASATAKAASMNRLIGERMDTTSLIELRLVFGRCFALRWANERGGGRSLDGCLPCTFLDVQIQAVGSVPRLMSIDLGNKADPWGAQETHQRKSLAVLGLGTDPHSIGGEDFL